MGRGRRTVTILFLDVKGSTALAEKLDPEDVLEVMQGAFEFLIGPVYRYKGTLAQLMNDAVLAFFGAPIAHEDDAERARRAGLEIIAGAKEYAAKLERERGLSDFNIRLAVPNLYPVPRHVVEAQGMAWAGPYSGLILGGLASMVLVLWPAFSLNPILFQFAFLSYVTVLLNLFGLLASCGLGWGLVAARPTSAIGMEVILSVVSALLPLLALTCWFPSSSLSGGRALGQRGWHSL